MKNKRMVRRASVYQHDELAGELWEGEDGDWCFQYRDGYAGVTISLTLPYQEAGYRFSASSINQSVDTIRSAGTISRYPDVGLGVVGT
ncbi:MAG: hypothetical protein ACI9DF_005854 [Verrucomicrobiales bacterium]|jgi:hypothetical protein